MSSKQTICCWYKEARLAKFHYGQGQRIMAERARQKRMFYMDRTKYKQRKETV